MRFPATIIDLATLPPPQAIDPLDYESILAAMKADALARLAGVGIVLDTLVLESEPVTVILEACAYRELLLRALVNDKAKAVLLAFATGNDLVHVGARFGVLPMPAVAAPRGDFGTYPDDWESEARYRTRIQLAPDAYSNAGTLRGYQYHVLSASLEIADVAALSPAPGRVDLVCLGRTGAPSDAAIAAVYARVTSEDVKPLTDDVRVMKAKIVPYTISAVLRIPNGPDPAAIRATALASVKAYTFGDSSLEYQFGALGTVHTVSAITGALQVPNVLETLLAAPAANIDPGADGVAQASFDVTTRTPAQERAARLPQGQYEA